MEKKFSAIGLTLRKDNDTFKSTYEIMSDLSSVWEKLSDMQRADILESVAGKRQGQIVAALINNFESVEEALKSAENSFGSAADEHERAMDSIAFKSNQLSETLTQFFLNFLDRETIKDFIDALTSIVKLLDGAVNNSFVSFIVQTGLLTVALATVGKFLTGLSIKYMAYMASTTAATAATVAATAATWNFSAAIGGLTAAMKINPLFIAATAVAIGIYAVATATKSLSRNMEEARERTNQLTESYISNKSKIEELLDRYNELNALYQSGSLNNASEEYQEFLEVKNQLSDLLPTLTERLDEEGNAILHNNEKIREQIELLEQLVELKVQSDILSFREETEELRKQVEQKEKQIEQNKRSQERAEESLALMKKMGSEESAIINTKSRINDYDMQNVMLQQEILALKEQINNEQVAYFNNLLKMQNIEIDQNIVNNINEMIKSLGLADEEFANFSQDMINFFSQFDSESEHAIAMIDDLVEHLVDLGATSEQIETITNAVWGLGDALEGSKIHADNLDLSLEDKVSTLKEEAQSIQTLSDLYLDLAKGKELNAVQILDLIENNHALIDALDIQGDVLTLNKHKVLELMEAEEIAFKGKLEVRKAEIQADLAVLNTQLEIAKAKMDIIKANIKGEAESTRVALELAALELKARQAAEEAKSKANKERVETDAENERLYNEYSREQNDTTTDNFVDNQADQVGAIDIFRQALVNSDATLHDFWKNLFSNQDKAVQNWIAFHEAMEAGGSFDVYTYPDSGIQFDMSEHPSRTRGAGTYKGEFAPKGSTGSPPSFPKFDDYDFGNIYDDASAEMKLLIEQIELLQSELSVIDHLLNTSIVDSAKRAAAGLAKAGSAAKKGADSATKATEEAEKALEEYLSALEQFYNELRRIEQIEREIQTLRLNKDIIQNHREIINLTHKELKLQEERSNLYKELYKIQSDALEGIARDLTPFLDVISLSDNLKSLNINMEQYNNLGDDQKEILDGLIEAFDAMSASANETSDELLKIIKLIQDAKKEMVDTQSTEIDSNLAEMGIWKDYLEKDLKLVEILDPDNLKEINRIKNEILNITKLERDETQRVVNELYKQRDALDESDYMWNLINDEIIKYELKLKEGNIQIVEMEKNLRDVHSNIVDIAFKSYFDYLFKQIDKEIELLQKAKEAAKAKAQVRIDAIQAEIDKLTEQNDQLLEQEQREQKLLDIAKQKEKLANTEREKNTRMLIDGDWHWVANPRQVREETENLQNMQEDYYKWERDIAHKKQIEDLRNQISQIEEELKIEEQKYDDKITSLQDFVKEQKEILDSHGKEQITSMEELMEALIDVDEEMYADRLELLRDFVKEYNEIQDEMKKPEEKPDEQFVPPPPPPSQPSSGGSTPDPDTHTGINMKTPSGEVVKDVLPWMVDSMKKEGWEVLHEGGIVGGEGNKVSKFINDLFQGELKPEEMFAKLLKGEVVVNPVIGMEHLKNNINNMIRSIQPAIQSATPTAIHNHYSFHVDKVQTNDAREFINNLKRMAK